MPIYFSCKSGPKYLMLTHTYVSVIQKTKNQLSMELQAKCFYTFTFYTSWVTAFNKEMPGFKQVHKVRFLSISGQLLNSSKFS